MALGPPQDCPVDGCESRGRSLDDRLPFYCRDHFYLRPRLDR